MVFGKFPYEIVIFRANPPFLSRLRWNTLFNLPLS